MGGDNAPASVIDGADIAKAQAPHIEFIFVGDESRVRPLLAQTRHLQNAEILHTDVAVAAGDTASHAVRRGRDSSMWVAIAQVADKKADAVVSAGNTGALMAMSKLQLRTMPGVTRPAIAGFFQPSKSACVCLTLVQILNAMKITWFNLR